MELQVVGKGSMGEDMTWGQWSNGSRCLERFVELWGEFGFNNAVRSIDSDPEDLGNGYLEQHDVTQTCLNNQLHVGLK